MKIMLTGADGQVGWELRRALAPLGPVVAFGRQHLDLSDGASITRVTRETEPDIIVNTGAYTHVDRAEADHDLAMAVNGIAPGILAEECRRLGAILIHYSTDYVFDGSKGGPYLESDPMNPLNVYGATKLAGEQAVRAAAAAHIILRTSWVYGLRGRNFLLTILRLAAARDELTVVDDQIGAPTLSRSLADATANIVRSWVAGTAQMERQCGETFHVTSGGSTSWFGFAKTIVRLTEGERGRSPVIAPVSSEQFKTAALRPRNSLLSNEKLRSTFGFALPAWEEDLRRVLLERRPI